MAHRRGIGLQLKTTFRLLLCVVAVIAGVAAPAQAANPTPATDPPYIAGEVLVGWRVGSAGLPRGAAPSGLAEDRASPAWQDAADFIAARTGLEALDVEPEYGTARLAVPPGQEQAEIQRLSELPWIAYAEPNYIAHTTGQPSLYPNDPYIGDQWNLRRIGAPAAWDATLGSYSVVVAVVDTGIDRFHPEFANRLSPGYDYVNQDLYADDDHVFSHGTHVAGIVAAAANNGQGIAGLAPNVKILPLKVLDANGFGTHANIGLAIRRAADNGVEVINLSLESSASSSTLRDAVAYATQKGSLVVAAAGNQAQDGNPDIYPAAYPEVLAVAASDHYDNWAPYSSHRPYVDLAAPGGIPSNSAPDRAEYEIRSTVRVALGSYGFEAGTSMAAPLASAAAALVRTFMPFATPAAVADILRNTADKVGTDAVTGLPFPYVNGRNDYFGYGRLNVARAVRWAYPPALQVPAVQHDFLMGGPVSRRSHDIQITNPSEQPISWEAKVLAGTPWLTVAPAAGVTTFSDPANLTIRVEATGLASGYYGGLIEVAASSQQQGTQVGVLLHVVEGLAQQHIPLLSHLAATGAWVDPLSGGQPLHLVNNSALEVKLPFAVPFYDRTYDRVWVSDNGFISFGNRYLGPVYGQSTCLPTAAGPNNAIYALWEELDPGRGGEVYAQQIGADRFAITWYEVPQGSGLNPQSFQIVLSSTGAVSLQYLSVRAGSQATIGIENRDGTVAQQVLCGGNGRQVADGDVLYLDPRLPW